MWGTAVGLLVLAILLGAISLVALALAITTGQFALGVIAPFAMLAAWIAGSLAFGACMVAAQDGTVTW